MPINRGYNHNYNCFAYYYLVWKLFKQLFSNLIINKNLSLYIELLNHLKSRLDLLLLLVSTTQRKTTSIIKEKQIFITQKRQALTSNHPLKFKCVYSTIRLFKIRSRLFISCCFYYTEKTGLYYIEKT